MSPRDHMGSEDLLEPRQRYVAAGGDHASSGKMILSLSLNGDVLRLLKPLTVKDEELARGLLLAPSLSAATG